MSERDFFEDKLKSPKTMHIGFKGNAMNGKGCVGTG